MVMMRLIKQDFINLIKTPVVVSACTYYPWLLIAMFGFVFSSLYGGDGVTSYDYYGVTIMIFMIVSSVTITPNTFFEEKLRKGNIRIAFSPVSRVSIYVSKLISSFIFMAVSFSISIIAMNYFNIVNFGGQNLKYILLLFAAFLMFSVSLGGAACVIFKSEELTNTVITVVTNILSVFSGLFFPLDGLGEWINKIASLCPLKWIVDVTFNVIYDGNFKNYTLVIIGFIILSAVCIMVMNFCYKPEDYI